MAYFTPNKLTYLQRFKCLKCYNSINFAFFISNSIVFLSEISMNYQKFITFFFLVNI